MQTLDPKILRNFIKGSGLSHKENSVSYIFECPRCNKKDKLYIRKTDGRFVCWKCKDTDNYKGRADYALADLTGQPIREIHAVLYGEGWIPAATQLEVDLSSFYSEEDEDPEVEIVSWPWNYYHLAEAQCVRGQRYLEGRGVPLEIAQQYGVRYCPELRQIVFPVASGGLLYGWQGRIVYPEKIQLEDGSTKTFVKSPTSKGLKKERFLMFQDRIADSKHIVVTEGPIDAIKAHLCGGNVCTMGKGVSKAQIGLLKTSGKPVYLALDEDAADDTARVVKELAADVPVYSFPELPKSTDSKVDLGALGFQEVYDLFRRATRVNGSRLFIFLKG